MLHFTKIFFDFFLLLQIDDFSEKRFLSLNLQRAGWLYWQKKVGNLVRIGTWLNFCTAYKLTWRIIRYFNYSFYDLIIRFMTFIYSKKTQSKTNTLTFVDVSNTIWYLERIDSKSSFPNFYVAILWVNYAFDTIVLGRNKTNCYC